MSEVEHFMPILMEKEEEGTLSPILAHGGVRFMWIKHNNLYRILCAADRSLNESQNSLGQRDLKDHSVPTLLPQPLNQAADQAAPSTMLLKTHSVNFFHPTVTLNACS